MGGRRLDEEAARVEQGEHDEHAVVEGEVEEDVGVQAVEEGLAVAEDCPLGTPGGAGRVHDDVRLLGIRGSERRGHQGVLSFEAGALREEVELNGSLWEEPTQATTGMGRYWSKTKSVTVFSKALPRTTSRGRQCPIR